MVLCPSSYSAEVLVCLLSLNHTCSRHVDPSGGDVGGKRDGGIVRIICNQGDITGYGGIGRSHSSFACFCLHPAFLRFGELPQCGKGIIILSSFSSFHRTPCRLSIWSALLDDCRGVNNGRICFHLDMSSFNALGGVKGRVC